MHASHSAQLLNIALRGSTLASKFLLIVFLAGFLEPAELGIYGLITASIGYALYVVGFDFYTYTSREILKHGPDRWGGLLKNQAALSLILYAIFLPLMLLIFSEELLPWHVAGWFFVLLILEHLNQELGRLLVVISEQLAASLLLFLRSGLWALVVTALMFLAPETRDLDIVLGGWTIGSFGGLLIGVSCIHKKGISGWREEIDWRWIANGLKIATPLLIATLALRGLFTFDRYLQQALTSTDILGVYVLFIGIGTALMSFLDAGVFAFSYPALIAASQAGDARAFSEGYRKLLLQTALLSAAFALIAALTINPLLGLLGKALYLQHVDLFYWVMLVICLYAASMVPHYGLYAQGHDLPIIVSHITSLMVFGMSTWIFSKYWPSQAVPLGLCVAFAWMFFWKSWAYYRLTPVAFRSYPARS